MHESARTWQANHLRAVEALLAPLRALPDGTLEEVRSPLHTIRIIKHDQQIHFYFVNADGTLDGPMSRIDLRRPLHLIAEYTQAALLGLLWVPAPRRVCLLGLAGGRLSLVLYHTLPSLVIDNVEIDPAVGTLAERYFGITFDQRQRLIFADARAYLATAGEPYDMIVMDAFRDSTDQLDHLATQQFYASAKQRLHQQGVVVANMLNSDPLYQAKLATFGASFRQALGLPTKHGAVVFGCDGVRLNALEITRRVSVVQSQFSFDLEQRAGELRPLRELIGEQRGEILRDNSALERN